MCGRYFISDEVNIEAFLERLAHRHDQQQLDLFKTGEIFPGQVAITYNKTGYELMRWNYQLFNRALINTRIESIRDKDIYRDDYRQHKCLIIASGFYEWDPQKNRYYVSGDDRYLFLAGIYQEGEDLNSFSIITREATSTRHIHQRVPLVLDRQQSLLFLDDKLSIEQLLDIQPHFNVESSQLTQSLF